MLALCRRKSAPVVVDQITATLGAHLTGLRLAGHNVILPTLALKASDHDGIQLTDHSARVPDESPSASGGAAVKKHMSAPIRLRCATCARAKHALLPSS